MVVTPVFNDLGSALTYMRTTPLGPGGSYILLVRHGETRANRMRLLRSPLPDLDRLSYHGRQQMRWLREALCPLPIQWSGASDLQRAVVSQKLAVGERNLPFTRLPGLRGFDYGSLTGLTFIGEGSALARRYPALYETFTQHRCDFAAPGGEDYASFRTRVCAAFREGVLPACQGKTGIVFGHKTSIREILLATVLDKTINQIKPPINTGSVSLVHFGPDDSPTLLLINNTDYLSSPE